MNRIEEENYEPVRTPDPRRHPPRPLQLVNSVPVLIGRSEYNKYVSYGWSVSNLVAVDCPFQSCKGPNTFTKPPYHPHIRTTWQCADCRGEFSVVTPDEVFK